MTALRCTPDLCVCGVYSSRADGEYEKCICGCPDCDDALFAHGSLEQAVSNLLNVLQRPAAAPRTA